MSTIIFLADQPLTDSITTIRPEDGVEITIISGESHGASVSQSYVFEVNSTDGQGFVRPVGGCWYIDFKLQKPGASVFQPIPEGWTAFVYGE